MNKKLSKWHNENKNTKEYKKRNKKISKKLKGKHISIKTEFKKGHKTWCTGKKLSKETKLKISKTKKEKGLHKGEKNSSWKGGISKQKGYYSHYNKLRKCKLRNAFGSHTLEEWEELKKFYDYKCLSCGKKEPEIKLSEDHIIPISKGGSNEIRNIQPLCISCNSKKHATTKDYRFNSLVIGAGEIGNSIFQIFSKYYNTYIIDKNGKCPEKINYLHICIPYTKNFIKEIKKYQKKYNPLFTIIHSTVPVKTCRKLNALSSPCVGLHPFMEKSIKTFTKFIGGKNAGEVADYFRRANIKCYLTEKQETTELIKILSTTYHGLCIEYTKEVKRLCDENNIPFEMWTLWTNNYNEGYEALGHPEYKRPNLIPIIKKIGGHCVLPNLDFIKSKFSDFIRSLNEKN